MIAMRRYLIALALTASACRRESAVAPAGWYGNNLARLDSLIAARGQTAAGYDKSRPPVAIFDWDNTVIKNDAGDATVFWMLQHDKVLQPPDRDWRRTSRYLTAEAAQALASACASLAEPGMPFSTSAHPDCAAEIVTIYEKGHTVKGMDAMVDWNHRRMQPQYAWAAQLHAGYTPEEVRAFSRMAESLANPIGATQSVGGLTNLPAYVRVYDQMRALIARMQSNGFDVWVVSASSQYVIEPYASSVGIPAERVIGIRPVVSGDRLTYGIEACGEASPGNDNSAAVDRSVIPYMDGKRCWVNRVVFGDRSAGAWERTVESSGRRAVFAAATPKAMCRSFEMRPHSGSRLTGTAPSLCATRTRTAMDAGSSIPCSSNRCQNAPNSISARHVDVLRNQAVRFHVGTTKERFCPIGKTESSDIEKAARTIIAHADGSIVIAAGPCRPPSRPVPDSRQA